MKISVFFLATLLALEVSATFSKGENKKQTGVCFFVQLEFFTFTSCF